MARLPWVSSAGPLKLTAAEYLFGPLRLGHSFARRVARTAAAGRCSRCGHAGAGVGGGGGGGWGGGGGVFFFFLCYVCFLFWIVLCCECKVMYYICIEKRTLFSIEKDRSRKKTEGVAEVIK